MAVALLNATVAFTGVSQTGLVFASIYDAGCLVYPFAWPHVALAPNDGLSFVQLEIPPCEP